MLLLLEHNANFTNPISISSIGSIYLVEVLRQQLFPLNSKLYEEKMKVVDFLQKHSIYYHKTPIPEFTLQRIKELYPDTWQEYIEKY